MSETSYIAIGRVSKTHGIDGALKLKIKDRYWDDFVEAKVLFIESAGKLVPYFIEALRGGQDPIVKFEDLNSRESAQALGGKEVFLRERDLLLVDDQRSIDQYERFVGYQLLDTELGDLGEIEEVVEMPGQYLAWITYAGRDVSIPLNPVFVQAVDHDKKTVHVSLPEGLLEL